MHEKFGFPFKLGPQVGLHIIHQRILYLRVYGFVVPVSEDNRIFLFSYGDISVD